jgi:hypothetical protein
MVLHVVENEGGVVEEFDGGGEGDAVLGGELQAFGEVEGEAGADAFAGASEHVGGGLSEVAGGAGGFGEELFDEREIVGARRGGAVGGGHGEKGERENLKLEGEKKSGRSSMKRPGRGEICVSV